MSPREVIARALYARYNPKGDWGGLPESIQKSYLADADAVIDALEEMDVTAKMWGAGVEAANAGGVEEIWFAMVGAMKDD